MKTVADLNSKYGVAAGVILDSIEGHVQFLEGRGGLPTVRLMHACGSSAEVTLFGGQVVSWRQASGDEVLYIRPDAVFDRSKPIAGGIPHCFPQFGPGPLIQHGFARLSDWEVAASSADPQPDDRDPEVQLILRDSDFSRGMWPHRFQLTYSVSLHGESLRLDARVVNVDDAALEFTTALHSYFEVTDVRSAAVRGLKDLVYLDKVADLHNPVRRLEDRDLIKFDGPTDSVYLSATDYVELHVGTGAAVGIASEGFPEVVVWNPWTSVAGYEHFVCVENATFATPVRLQPGESWRGQVALTVADL